MGYSNACKYTNLSQTYVSGLQLLEEQHFRIEQSKERDNYVILNFSRFVTIGIPIRPTCIAVRACRFFFLCIVTIIVLDI